MLRSVVVSIETDIERETPQTVGASFPNIPAQADVPEGNTALVVGAFDHHSCGST